MVRRDWVLVGRVVVLVAFAAVTGCKRSNNSSSSSSTGSTSTAFKMSGSSQAANVAQLSRPKFLEFILPRAVALAPPAMLDRTGATVTLSQAWIVIKQIEFKTDEVAGSNEVEGSDVSFVGPYVVDLLATSPVTLDTQPVPNEAIRRIRMKLHKTSSLPAGAPSDLNNNSIFLSAVVGSNAFKFKSDDTAHFDLAGSSSVAPSADADFLVSINLANVFKQIDLSNVAPNAIITVSNRVSTSGSKCPNVDASASDIYTCIRTALQKHANLGKDRNHDGDLDGSDDRIR